MNITSPNLMAASHLVKTAEARRASYPQRVPAQSDERSRRFDSVTIASAGSFEQELRGKISQEVRTATSSGLVASLRDQVRSGAYQADSNAIARKLLLVGEAV